MVKYIIWIMLCLIVFKVCSTASNLIVFKNIKGCFGINRFSNKIQMIGGKKLSRKQFIKNAIDYIDSLEVGKEYVTVTHTILKDYIIENKSKYNLKVDCNNKIVKSRILIEKIWLFNFKDFRDKVDFYEVHVTKLK
ncbi:MAG: hypothetical protein RSB77_03615 [Bacilli bacterium]